MDRQSASRRRLSERMNESRARQQAKWEEIATRAGISVSLLRKIRSGDVGLTMDSKLAIERGFRWSDGDVDRVMREPDYIPSHHSATTSIDLGQVERGDLAPDQVLEVLATLIELGEDAFWKGLHLIAAKRAERERTGRGRSA